MLLSVLRGRAGKMLFYVFGEELAIPMISYVVGGGSSQLECYFMFWGEGAVVVALSCFAGRVWQIESEIMFFGE